MDGDVRDQIDVASAFQHGRCDETVGPRLVGIAVIEDRRGGGRMEHAAVEVDAPVARTVVLPKVFDVQRAARVQIDAEILFLGSRSSLCADDPQLPGLHHAAVVDDDPRRRKRPRKAVHEVVAETGRVKRAVRDEENAVVRVGVRAAGDLHGRPSVDDQLLAVVDECRVPVGAARPGAGDRRLAAVEVQRAARGRQRRERIRAGHDERALAALREARRVRDAVVGQRFAFIDSVRIGRRAQRRRHNHSKQNPFHVSSLHNSQVCISYHSPPP